MISTQETNWSRVDAGFRPILQDSLRLVSEVLGPSLLSITLFGEAVTGGFDRRFHSVRSILVLQSVELPLLRKLAENGPRLAKAGMTAPIAVTTKYIHDSLDTFPLEWLEIQQQGVTVAGPDEFSSLVLESENIRLQCEREIKRLLMGLRQALLSAAGKVSAVGLIERDATDNLMRTLRGMLWLHGRHEHLAAEIVIQEVEKILGVKLDGVRSALNRAACHDWNEFDRFYADVEILMGKADAL
jgi:hypothetical protein